MAAKKLILILGVALLSACATTKTIERRHEAGDIIKSETYNENFTRSWNAIRYAIRSGETFRIRAFQRSCKWDYFPADRSMIGICGFFIQPQIGIYFVELGPEKTKIDFVKGASFCLYRDGFVHDLIEIADKRLHRRFKAKE